MTQQRRGRTVQIFGMLLAIAGFSAASPTFGADADAPWLRHLQAGRQAQSERDWTAAERSFEAALAEAGRVRAPGQSTLEVLEAWVRAALAHGRKDRAAELLGQIVERYRSEPDGARDNKMIDALLQRANLLNQIGPYAEAERLFGEALELQQGSPDAMRTSRTLRGLNSTLARLRPDDPRREELLRADLALDESPDGHHLLATYYRTNGMYEQALVQYDEAQVLLGDEHDPSDSTLAEYLIGAGQAHEALGRFDEAEREYLRALALLERSFGRSHPRIAYALKHVGSLYVDRERYAEAEPYLRRADEIERVTRGAEHDPCGCDVSALLQRVERALGGAAAGPARSSGDDAGTDRVAPDDPQLAAIETLYRRIAALERQGEFEAGLELADAALQLGRDRGEGSPQMLQARRTKAQLLSRRTRHEEAVEAGIVYVQMLETAGQADTTELADALGDLATSLRNLGRNEEAVPAQLREIGIREALGQRMRAAQRLESLGYLERAQGRHEASRPAFERAEALWVEMAGERAPEIVRLRTAVATSLIAEAHYDQAEAILTALLADVEERDVVEPWVVRQLLQALQELYGKTGRQEAGRAIEARIRELNGG